MWRCTEALCRIENQQEGGYHRKIAGTQDKGLVDAPKAIFGPPTHHLGPLRSPCVASRAGLQPKGTGCYLCTEQVFLTW